MPYYADQQIYPDDDQYFSHCLTMMINRSILMMTTHFLMPYYADQQIYPDDDQNFSPALTLRIN